MLALEISKPCAARLRVSGGRRRAARRGGDQARLAVDQAHRLLEVGACAHAGERGARLRPPSVHALELGAPASALQISSSNGRGPIPRGAIAGPALERARGLVRGSGRRGGGGLDLRGLLRRLGRPEARALPDRHAQGARALTNACAPPCARPADTKPRQTPARPRRRRARNTTAEIVARSPRPAARLGAATPSPRRRARAGWAPRARASRISTAG